MQTSTQALASLLNPALDRQPDWQPAELAAVLAHQLAAPLEFDLTETDPAASKTLAASRTALKHPLRSFGDLFQHPQPPLAVLQLTKEFAKHQRRSRGQLLPPEIASVIYFASIALTLIHHDRRITRLDDRALSQGFTWAQQQSWLTDSLRGVFQTALTRMETHGRPDPTIT